jgi:hypothetical protein
MNMHPELLQAEPITEARAAVQPTAPAPAPAAAGAAADDSDISALLDSATLTDTEKIDMKENWECGICLLGLEAGRHLVSAHAVTTNRSGKQRLHVFHRDCLQQWSQSGSECSQLCPTCKLRMHPRPLPAAWTPGITRLSAHMGVNQYMVCGFNTTSKKMCDI